MSTKVIITPVLQDYFNIPSVLLVNGNTIGECLDDLIRQYPEARGLLFDQNDMLPVLVSINNQETVIMNSDNLDRVMNSDDEIQISAVIGGG